MQVVAVFGAVAAVVSVYGEQFLHAVGVLQDNYGPRAGVALYFLFRSTATQYLRVQRSVLNGKDEDAVQFRQAVTNECNMTAIAVSVFSLLLIFLAQCPPRVLS